MGGRSSLPTPGERSNNDFSGHPSLFWSPWLELGGANNKVLVQDSIPTLHTAARSFSCKAVLDHFPAVYPSNTFLKISLPNEFLEVHSPE